MLVVKLTVLCVVLSIIWTLVLKFAVRLLDPLDIAIVKRGGNYPNWFLVIGFIMFILQVLDAVGIISSVIYLLFLR